MQHIDVSVLCGSLRQKSFSRSLGRALERLAPPGMALSPVEIGDLPHYNEDLESDAPAAYGRFRRTIAASDAVLFVTPEFNRSLPGVLKNAVDVGSRPWGKSVWAQKPAAVIGVSPGAFGAFGANHHLRQVLMGVNVSVMPHPEAYIGGAAGLFDGSGELTHAATREFLTGFMAAFKGWIDQQRCVPA